MPTNRPRLSVTLTPELDRALEGFCDTIGISRSAFIVQSLESALPQLERMALLVQQLKSAAPEALAAVKARSSNLEAMLAQLTASANAPLDLFDSIQPGSRKSSQKAGKGPKSPPAPNRGGSSPLSSSKPDLRSPGKVTRLRDRRPQA